MKRPKSESIENLPIGIKNYIKFLEKENLDNKLLINEGSDLINELSESVNLNECTINQMTERLLEIGKENYELFYNNAKLIESQKENTDSIEYWTNKTKEIQSEVDELKSTLELKQESIDDLITENLNHRNVVLKYNNDLEHYKREIKVLHWFVAIPLFLWLLLLSLIALHH